MQAFRRGGSFQIQLHLSLPHTHTHTHMYMYIYKSKVIDFKGIHQRYKCNKPCSKHQLKTNIYIYIYIDWLGCNRSIFVFSDVCFEAYYMYIFEGYDFIRQVIPGENLSYVWDFERAIQNYDSVKLIKVFKRLTFMATRVSLPDLEESFRRKRWDDEMTTSLHQEKRKNQTGGHR